MDLAGIGSVLGGLGQLAAGTNLFGGSSSDVYSIDNSYRAMATGMTQAAEIMGVNPMALLGISPYQAQPQYTGVNTAQMGQGLNKILSAGQSQLQKAQIENMNARTNYINAQAAKLNNNTPEGQGIIESDLPPPNNPAYSGPNAMEQVLFQQKMNGERILEFLPSQQAQDYLSESYIDNMKYRLQKEAQGIAMGVKRMDQKLISELRDWLDRLEMYYPSRKGWHYAWNFKIGRPVEIRNNKYGRSNLFDNKRLFQKRYTGFDSKKNWPGR